MEISLCLNTIKHFAEFWRECGFLPSTERRISYDVWSAVSKTLLPLCQFPCNVQPVGGHITRCIFSELFCSVSGLLSNNHQSSGIFYPNITLPQIGPNLSTATVSHLTAIFPDLEKKLDKIVKLLLKASLTFSIIAFIVLFLKLLLFNKTKRLLYTVQ